MYVWVQQNLVRGKEGRKEGTDLEGEAVQRNETVPVTTGYYLIRPFLHTIVGIFYLSHFHIFIIYIISFFETFHFIGVCFCCPFD